MKYLILLLCIVIFKYIFNREGLYSKNIKVQGGIPDVSNLSDNNKFPMRGDLENKSNLVNENIFKKQISAININNIPLF